ncbi:hypothetical protein CNR22_24150 [Sphingobacteriaceae bacterium]|nr:hypothetical protein CNR22_24150 [Sphingobacteriaceae bacterium]
MVIFRFFSVLILTFFLNSCTKKDPEIKEEPAVPGTVSFNFQAKVNGKNLLPDTKYTNASHDTFTVSKLTYYITNVKLTRADGSVVNEQNSYHLIQHLENKTSFVLTDIPEGTYTKIEFLIGVDSLTNVGTIRTGALDPANDMYWAWEGYLFLKMEGVFNSGERPETGDYAIHVGGYKGPNACLQTCSFSLTTPIVIKQGSNSSVLYTVQVDEMFTKPLPIGFDYYYDRIASDPKIFQKISENYKDMFVVSGIQN